MSSAPILVIEDNFNTARMLEDLLVALGHKVIHAADGLAGIELARKEKPRLILLDLMLPKVNGFEICRCLKADPKTRPVNIIVITALGRMEDVEKAFSAGASDYLTKPFDVDRLAKKIEKHLPAA